MTGMQFPSYIQEGRRGSRFCRQSTPALPFILDEIPWKGLRISHPLAVYLTNRDPLFPRGTRVYCKIDLGAEFQKASLRFAIAGSQARVRELDKILRRYSAFKKSDTEGRRDASTCQAIIPDLPLNDHLPPSLFPSPPSSPSSSSSFPTRYPLAASDITPR